MNNPEGISSRNRVGLAFVEDVETVDVVEVEETLLTDAVETLDPEPVSNQKKKRRKNLFQRILKKFFVLVARAYVSFFYYTWPILKKAIKPKFVFAVYGNRKQQGRFFSESFTKKARRAFPIGFMFFRGKLGMYCASPRTEEEMAEKPAFASAYLMGVLSEFPKTKHFALAGRLPSFDHKARGKNVPEPLRDGSMGTRYVMLRTAEALAKKLGKTLSETTFCIPGGAGFTGAKVVEDLSRICRFVIALDPRYEMSETMGNVLRTNDARAVGQADAVIILTGNGKEVENFIPYLHNGMVLADDTHPPVPKYLREQVAGTGAMLYNTVAEARRGIRMIPALPGFEPSNVPGCLLQCVVEMTAGRYFDEHDFSRFCDEADKLGFYAKLISHPD